MPSKQFIDNTIEEIEKSIEREILNNIGSNLMKNKQLTESDFNFI